MGSSINNEASVYHWCHLNNIPVFSPGITDSGIGDSIFFNRSTDKRFVIDVNEDLNRIVNIVKNAKGRPMASLILGGGIVRYHVMNAFKLGAGGCDYSIILTNGGEYDCSNSGSKPE